MSKLCVDRHERNYIIGKQIEKYSKIYIILLALISAFELALFIRGFIVFEFNTHRYLVYMLSYSFLFISSIAAMIFLLIGRKKNFKTNLYSILIRTYSIAIVIWSLIISYLDMARENMPIVYLTVIVTIAAVVVIEPLFYIPLIISSFVLLIGLDAINGFKYFVSFSEYINITVFIAMAIIISFRLYVVSIKDFKHHETLEQSVLEERNRVSAISLQTIQSICNAVDAKDKYTKEHSSRVAEYSKIIATNLKWEENKIDEIYEIALLHDIGKIGVPDSILNSTNKLTDEEFALMKQHTIIGGNILKDLTILENVDLGAKYHHERYDGTGYPNGLKGEEIPLVARVISVADAFDAMNSNRIYRKRLTKEKIISELENGKGTQFDPVILDAFMPSALEILENEE